eukprot:m.279950 g.279950  ORF g.279950 m.279950 type:complete len:820 (+) comp16323_c12_seq1:226-2685(+)
MMTSAGFFVPLNVTCEARHQILSWRLHAPVSHVTSSCGSPQRLVVAFRVSRQPWTYIYNVILIMFMTATLVAGAFFVPINDLADRAAITLTILLTAVAFKLVLQDGLPQVSYLTLLDKYVLVCFLAIFLVAVESTVVAFLVGIEHTTSCGGGCGEETGISKSSVFTGGGRATYDVALKLELYFMLAIAWFWLIYNSYFIWNARTLTTRTINKWGQPVHMQSQDAREERLKSNHESDDSEHEDDDPVKSVTSIDGEANGTQPIKSVSTRQRFVHYHNRASMCALHLRKGGRKESVDSVGEKGLCYRFPKELHKHLEAFVKAPIMSQQMLAIHGTLINAGFKMSARGMAVHAVKAGMSLDVFKHMDVNIVWEMLSDLKIPLTQRTDLMMVAKKQVDIIYLQGSASYLLMELGFDGVLVSKLELLNKLENTVAEIVDSSASIPIEGKRLKTLANVIYGKLLVSSSATPCLNFFGKREVHTSDSEYQTVHTQLWAGYADTFARTKLFPKFRDKDELKYIVIDLGSGQFKSFVVQSTREKPGLITKIKEDKDDKNPATYMELLDEFTKGNLGIKETARKIAAVMTNGTDGNFLQHTRDSFFSDGDKCAGIALCATANTRNKFAPPPTLKDYFCDENDDNTSTLGDDNISVLGEDDNISNFGDDDEGLQDNKGLDDGQIKDIIEAVHSELAELVKATFGEECICEFEILNQHQEAACEFAASESALIHGINLPAGVQGKRISMGNLAWGSGSCQGFPLGTQDAVVCLPFGLKHVQKVVESAMKKSDFDMRVVNMVENQLADDIDKTSVRTQLIKVYGTPQNLLQN